MSRKRTFAAVLDCLANLKSRFLLALLRIRTASAALSLGDYRAFIGLITGSTSGFSDPARLTRWTRGFLYADLARLLAPLIAQALMMIVGPIQQSEVVGVVWWALKGFLFLGVAILLPAWTLRANHNARQLGASTMTFAPEWAMVLPATRIVLEAVSGDAGDLEDKLGSPRLEESARFSTCGLVVGPLASERVGRRAGGRSGGADPGGWRRPGSGKCHQPCTQSCPHSLDLTLILLTIIARVQRMQMAHYNKQRDVP